MNNQSAGTNSQSTKWRSWLVLFLRWLLGALAGIGISASIYFALKNHTLDISPILSVPFIGQLLLFDPSFSANDIVSPALIWGLIGTLPAAGGQNQITTGKILLVLYVIVGCISFFRVLMMIPT